MVWAYRSGMDFAVLGPLLVTGSDGPIDVPGVKERTLLAILVANVGRLVPGAVLVEGLWGAEPPRSAVKSLQTYVSRLRNVLEPDRAAEPRTGGDRWAGLPVGGAERRRWTRSGLWCRPIPVVDALADHRPDAAVRTLRAALEMWRGPAYAGFESTSFGQAEARRLGEIRLTAMEDCFAAELAVGAAAAVVPEVERLLGDQPYRERLWSLLILALYRCGRQGDAVGAFDRARRVLVEELGIEPGRELRDLQGRVLAQDPGLDLSRRGGRAAGVVGGPGAGVDRPGHRVGDAAAVVGIGAVRGGGAGGDPGSGRCGGDQVGAGVGRRRRRGRRGGGDGGWPGAGLGGPGGRRSRPAARPVPGPAGAGPGRGG